MNWRVACSLTAGWLTACAAAPPAPAAGTEAEPPAHRSADTADAPPERAPAPAPDDAGATDSQAPDAGPGRDAPPPSAPPRFAAPHARTASTGDGEWSPLPSDLGPPLLYETTVHPSPGKAQVKVTLVAFDLAHVAPHFAPGTREPVARGVPPEARPGLVPGADQAALLAVTNGGWRSEHGHFAMRVGPHRFDTPKPGACTLALDSEGRLAVAPWEQLAARDAELGAWRQTPACLITRGALHPALVHETLTRRWGAAVDGGVEIPRTALGLDATGRYALFALGENTSAKALADALLAGGAVSAAELDINWSYTRFFLFGRAPDAPPGAPPRIVRSIGTKGQHPATSYVVQRSERDFMYFTRKPP